jgi:hypothetical protein
MTMVIAEFIDHEEEDNKGNCQRNGKSQGIDKGIKFIALQKPEGRFKVVSDHAVLACNLCSKIAISVSRRNRVTT